MPDLGSVHGAGSEAAIRRRSRTRRTSAAAGDNSGGEEEAKANNGVVKQEYKCRFCAQLFEKSQALGGHMNRHRPEREKEQFEHAQQIVAQQQMPRTWSSHSAPEMLQSPSGPSGGGSDNTTQRLSSHLSLGTTHQQYVAPISFGTLYRPTSPANCNMGTQLPPSQGSNCNFYLPSLPSNASSCINLQGTNAQNQLNQQQMHHQWLGSMDFPNATSNSSRAISFQTGSVPEVLANIMRNSGTPNGDGSPLVSPGTPTSSQAQAPGTYDVMYNAQLANAFFNGGM